MLLFRPAVITLLIGSPLPASGVHPGFRPPPRLPASTAVLRALAGAEEVRVFRGTASHRVLVASLSETSHPDMFRLARSRMFIHKARRARPLDTDGYFEARKEGASLKIPYNFRFGVLLSDLGDEIMVPAPLRLWLARISRSKK